MHLMNAVEPGLVSTGQKFLKGATGDLTKGGQPVNLKDEIIALLSGVRIINIDVLKSMEYKTGEFNRLMRAIDDTEKLYSPEGYNSRGPEVILQEYNQMQLEGYKVQQNFHKMIVDAKTIGVSTFDIRRKLKDQGFEVHDTREQLMHDLKTFKKIEFQNVLVLKTFSFIYVWSQKGFGIERF